MKVLVACEMSGRVREAFRRKGHEAYSCDILPAVDESPHHIQDDVSGYLDKGWDLIIGHPPCTHLSTINSRPMTPEREELRREAFAFFMLIYNADCPRVAVENPRGVVARLFRPADQYIHPYMFGEPYQKLTGLWLRGLPLLVPTNWLPDIHVTDENGRGHRPNRLKWMPTHSIRPGDLSSGGGARNRWMRSLTFLSIAEAMADQWG